MKIEQDDFFKVGPMVDKRWVPFAKATTMENEEPHHIDWAKLRRAVEERTVRRPGFLRPSLIIVEGHQADNSNPIQWKPLIDGHTLWSLAGVNGSRGLPWQTW